MLKFIRQNQFIIKLFLIWRSSLFFISAIAGYFLSYKPSFPYASSVLAQSGLPQWLYSFANFDGVHYLTIVKNGYVGTGLIQAFFPVYPFLIKILSFLKLEPIIAGLLISNLAFFGCLYFAKKLLLLDFNAKITRRFLLILTTFPTAFFFGSLYTESLFLLLIFVSLYYFREQKLPISAAISGLASGTRLIGLFLLPGFLLKKQFKKLPINKKLVFSLVAILGLIIYMSYLWGQFQDPLYFFHVQADFNAGRQESIILLPQVFYRYFKILISVPVNLKYFSYVQELVLTSAAGIILFLASFNSKIDRSYLVFSWLSFLLPTLTGTFSSMPRYILVCFPIYLWLALKLDTQCKFFSYLTIQTILLIINTILFIQGYWVA